MLKKILTFLLSSSCVLSSAATPLKVGDKLPDISLVDENSKPVALKSFLGRKMVLFFYPKDSTPGCTKEACSLRDSYDFFQKNNIALIGINYDTPASHKKFKDNYHLPFTLLTDVDGNAAKLLGAYTHWWHYFAPARITLIIDEQGIVRHILPEVDVTSHAEQIKKLL